MGIQINGNTDTISAVDGSLTVSGAELPTVTNLNATGIVTATSFSGPLTGNVIGNLTGTASTATAAATAFGLSGSPTLSIGAGSTSAPSISPSGDSNTGIFFPSPDTIAFGEGGAEAFRVDSSGRLLVGTTSATANGGVLELSGGITFPATAVAASNANTLDDYEEGTFTPTIAGASVTYTTQTGIYRKVGSLVWVFCRVAWSAKSSGLYINIDGLPFGSADQYVPCTIGVFGIPLTATYTYVTYYLGSPFSSTTMYANQYKPDGTGADVTLPNSGLVTLAVTYRV